MQLPNILVKVGGRATMMYTNKLQNLRFYIIVLGYVLGFKNVLEMWCSVFMDYEINALICEEANC